MHRPLSKKQKVEYLLQVGADLFQDSIEDAVEMYMAVMRGQQARYCDLTDKELDEAIKELQ